ncbi:hypothetical protein AVEN_988-1 [Araneus ventricosus]|uniref:Uncharacterized protein n=1 Tax=Araneus ventricosus TaxID=182803 RepID=A0A4Y2CWD7_ARAVE|nr:hypothetical protein AVEN_988-1 [Araneus ventricosus]
MGNLADDLKMVKNELRLLQGDIRNFKEERQSLLLQIQEKYKKIDYLKSNNDSLVKTNSYYDTTKTSQVKYYFVKETSWRLEENLTRQVNQQNRNHDTKVLWLSHKYALVTNIESHS